VTKTTIRLDFDTMLALRPMAETQGRSQSGLIRDVLIAYTGKAKRPRISGIGEFDGGRTDISERAEDLLRRAAKRGS
jgi:hypothetical protein